MLLVSVEFFASEFIDRHELAPLLERAKSNGVTILWVAVSSSGYKVTELAKYQCVNKPHKPLDMLTDGEQNAELVAICEQIKDALGS